MQVDGELRNEIGEECSKYGEVVSVSPRRDLGTISARPRRDLGTILARSRHDLEFWAWGAPKFL